ncbi:MAG TPA: hypothetical protein VHL59_11890, partial [Thermoanaerobaculia bacterium]|nr:hypothetical protein [Thermoanaerobaculia bacterium]
MTGTWSISLDTTCWTSGSHPIRVVAEACPGPNAKRQTWQGAVTIDRVPEVTATYIGPDAAGNGSLSIDYNFPGTAASSQRAIHVYLDGASYPNYFATAKPGAIEGNWTIAMNTTCWTTGDHPIRVKAESCPAGVIEWTTWNGSVTVDSTPKLTNANVSGPDAAGTGTLSVDYEFPNTASSTQRDLKLYLDGASYPDYIARATAPARTGTWVVPLDYNCWSSGVHDFRIVAEACLPSSDPSFRTTADATVTIDGAPTVSVAFTGPDAAGNGTLSVDYTFPPTSASSARHITVYLDGTSWPDHFARHTAAGMEGRWNLAIDTTCWTQGAHAVRVVADYECPTPDQSLRATGSATIEVNNKPAASVAVVKAGDGSWDALVDFSFPQTDSSTQRHLRLEWLPSGTFIGEARPGSRSGTWVVDLPGCATGSGEMVRVTATACGSLATEDAAPASLPSCEQACSVECPDCVGAP